MVEFLVTGVDSAIAQALGPRFDTELKPDRRYLVSNKEDYAEIYAPEAERFLARSRSDAKTKAAALRILFEARAIRFDRLFEEERTRAVGRRVAVLGEETKARAIGEALKESFEVVVGPEPSGLKISGSIGAFRIKTGELYADCDLVVLSAPDRSLAGRKGVLVAQANEDWEVFKIRLSEMTGDLVYRAGVDYAADRCQLHNRQSAACMRCAEVCPTGAVIKAEDANRLVFSDIDCIACGACVSVCPSAALEASAMPAAVFEEILPLYENTLPLVIAQGDLSRVDLPLPAGTVPLVLDNTGFLSEAQLLGLLQESGSQIVLYAPLTTRGLEEAIALINGVSARLYGKTAVLLARTQEALGEALEKAMPMVSARKSLRVNHAFKREQFAARLKIAVGSENYGTLAGPGLPLYGRVLVAEAGCTLCMSCVAACNTGALFVNKTSGALTGHFSKCAQCGECAAICPEKVMALEPSGIDLSPKWFEPVRLAQDEPFCCVECGKPFATQKSVMKIATMLEPLFMTDPIKARTLRCCAECKPKVMLAQYVAGRSSANQGV